MPYTRYDTFGRLFFFFFFPSIFGLLRQGPSSCQLLYPFFAYEASQLLAPCLLQALAPWLSFLLTLMPKEKKNEHCHFVWSKRQTVVFCNPISSPHLDQWDLVEVLLEIYRRKLDIDGFTKPRKSITVVPFAWVLIHNSYNGNQLVTVRQDLITASAESQWVAAKRAHPLQVRTKITCTYLLKMMIRSEIFSLY